MYKFVAGVILCCCSVYCGYSIKKYYKKRKLFYQRLVVFCNNVIDEISHLKTPITKIIDNFTAGSNDLLTQILKNYKTYLENGLYYDTQTREQLKKTIYLNKKEMAKIADFLDNIGKTEVNSQINILRHYLTEFEMDSKKADEEFIKMGNLYFKLSILIGIALIIIVL